jgi:hypothetical protein
MATPISCASAAVLLSPRSIVLLSLLLTALFDQQIDQIGLCRSNARIRRSLYFSPRHLPQYSNNANLADCHLDPGCDWLALRRLRILGCIADQSTSSKNA